MQPPFASPEEALEWRVIPLLNAVATALYTRRFDLALDQLRQAIALLEAAAPPAPYRIVWETCGVAGAFLAVQQRLTPDQLAQLEALGIILDRLLEAAEHADAS